MCEGKNTGIVKRSTSFDTGLTEQERYVMVVFRVYLQHSGILPQNATSLLSSAYRATSLAVSILLNDFILSQRRA
jgi:hypothetical protein